MPSSETGHSASRQAVIGSPHEIHVTAPAKVNLILRVLARRPDGYHDLWSLMQTVALEDHLTLRLKPDSVGIRIETDQPSLPTDRRNLIYRAAERVLAEAHVASGLDIAVRKRIPVSAGLGGGSSDAAATIAGLNRLLALGWPAEKMARVSEELGSDVPFFFFAPSAVVQGRGERVARLALAGERWVVLVHPGFPIETRWAYERLAASRAAVAPLSETLQNLSGPTPVSWDEVIPLMENDFEPALAPSHPELGEIKRALLQHGAEAALLSGSGATVFGVFKDENSAVRAETAVGRVRGRRAYAVRASGGSEVSEA